MKNRVRQTILAIHFLCLLFLWPTGAEAVQVNWWNHSTSQAHVIATAEPGSVRLGEFDQGFMKGVVALPRKAAWVVRLSVRADEDDKRSARDTVLVTLNGEKVDSFPNAPATAAYDVSFRFCGDQLAFRFDFTSANSLTSLHQSVSFGELAVEDETVFVGTVGGFNSIVGTSFFQKPAAASSILAQREFESGARDLLRFGELAGQPRAGGSKVLPDSPLAHTFTHLPAKVNGARLRMHLRAGTVGAPATDMVELLFCVPNKPASKKPAWVRSLGTAAGQPGLTRVSTSWNHNDDAYLDLDLAALPLANGTTTNLVPLIEANGFLDVVVSDDTGVEYAALDFTSAPSEAVGPQPIQIFTGVELEIPTEAGKCYQLQVSQDLVFWENIGERVFGTGAKVNKLLSSRRAPQSFYRATEIH